MDETHLLEDGRLARVARAEEEDLWAARQGRRKCQEGARDRTHLDLLGHLELGLSSAGRWGVESTRRREDVEGNAYLLEALLSLSVQPLVLLADIDAARRHTSTHGWKGRRGDGKKGTEGDGGKRKGASGEWSEPTQMDGGGVKKRRARRSGRLE